MFLDFLLYQLSAVEALVLYNVQSIILRLKFKLLHSIKLFVDVTMFTKTSTANPFFYFLRGSESKKHPEVIVKESEPDW